MERKHPMIILLLELKIQMKRNHWVPFLPYSLKKRYRWRWRDNTECLFSPCSLKWRYRRRGNTMRLYFTMLLMYMKIQPERKYHVFVFHYFPLYEDTDREETPCVCISPCSFIWKYRRRGNTMCLYFTMLLCFLPITVLLEIKIQIMHTERKHHVFVFHHASGQFPWNKDTDDTDGNTMCLYFTMLLGKYNDSGISHRLGSNMKLFYKY
jgi:hypothetical protein